MRDYTNDTRGVLANFDANLHQMIVVRKCTVDSSPFGLSLDTHNCALAFEYALGKLKKEFNPFVGAHSGNGSNTNPSAKQEGEEQRFVDLAGQSLDKALRENRVVTPKVIVLLAKIFYFECLRTPKKNFRARYAVLLTWVAPPNTRYTSERIAIPTNQMRSARKKVKFLVN